MLLRTLKQNILLNLCINYKGQVKLIKMNMRINGYYAHIAL
jgi:hypothetical protein